MGDQPLQLIADWNGRDSGEVLFHPGLELSVGSDREVTLTVISGQALVRISVAQRRIGDGE